MNATATRQYSPFFTGSRKGSQREHFREKFQRSLRSCVRKGFTLEESFGMIWVETWEEIAVTEEEQSVLYDELIRWAKSSFCGEIKPFRTVVHQSYSPVDVLV